MARLNTYQTRCADSRVQQLSGGVLAQRMWGLWFDLSPATKGKNVERLVTEMTRWFVIPLLTESDQGINFPAEARSKPLACRASWVFIKFYIPCQSQLIGKVEHKTLDIKKKQELNGQKL